jgi:hypothetical protein
MAEDRFKDYFAEKLWEMIPEVYRHEDGLGDRPGVLRALVEVLASQAAIVRRSHDRLWEDQFIELCEDWAVPYLGDLVGTRLVSALDLRARRVDVAKTIYYRRRKGTPAVLEELIGDMTGWEGTVVESFRRLARARHRLDPPPGALVGHFTRTSPGGWADLRSPRNAELVGGAFDELHYTPDVRRHRGRDGRYNIPKLGFHLYRLRAFDVSGVTPFSRGEGHYTFDPSGRDVPLFGRRRRSGAWAEWRRAREWDLPAPIPCRLLGHAEYEINAALLARLLQSEVIEQEQHDALRAVEGVRFRSEYAFRRALERLLPDLLDTNIYISLADGALVDECGRRVLLPGAGEALDSAAIWVSEGSDGFVPAARTTAGHLSEGATSSTDARLVIDPERGRLRFLNQTETENFPEACVVGYHYGFSGDIGAGTYDRSELATAESYRVLERGLSVDAGTVPASGLVQVEDSATYMVNADGFTVSGSLILQAKNFERPYLLLSESEQASRQLTITGAEDAVLVVDGLWIGASTPDVIVLTGDFENVILRHVTLDPGGATTDSGDGDWIMPVALVVEGHVELLEIESSITGPIQLDPGGSIETLVVRDSILQSTLPDIAVIQTHIGDTRLERVTLFGESNIHRLWATEVLATGTVRVTDTQTGCFRFGAAPSDSRLPHPYESHDIAGWERLFTSHRFGHPGYAQLSEAAPVELRRGAENGSEIGAYSSLLNPIKLGSLQTKVDEYLPFGLIPMYIIET